MVVKMSDGAVQLAQIVARVMGSPRFVHGYAVPELNEYWAHADGAAHFDVIHLDNASVLKAQGIEVRGSILKPTGSMDIKSSICGVSRLGPA